MPGMEVHVNVGMSADGKLSSRDRTRLAISGPADFERVDRLRRSADAVVVGVGTVQADDPSLTVEGADPARVIVDSRGRTPPSAAVLRGDAETIVCTAERAPQSARADLAAAGASLVTAGEDRVDLTRAFGTLQERHGIDAVLVEGGGELIFSLFAAGLVDRVTAFVGPLVIGGRDAPTLADGEGFVEGFPELALEGVERLGDGVLLEWRVDER